MAKKGKGKKASISGDDAAAAGDKKGKKGKKGKRDSAESEEVDKKGKKGKKGKKDSVSGKSIVSAAAPAELAKEPSVEVKAKPVPVVPAVPVCNPECDEIIKPQEPCRYTTVACCQEAIACRPNHYPGLLEQPVPMAVVGSECGTYMSLCRLLKAGFHCAERVFTMTPWGNYVLFRANNTTVPIYFLFDGCTCNVNRFRYLDLNCGTAGLLYFDQMHDVITYLIESRERRVAVRKLRKSVIDDICKEFCEYGDRHL